MKSDWANEWKMSINS